MTDSSPVPPVPVDCDLRGLPFMPLDVQRLRDSDLALESSGDEFKGAVLLWCASWLQVPAASLPNSDRKLAALAQVDEKKWKKIRTVALSGWNMCSDGRLYHSVVAEKAMEALPRRQEHAERTTAAAERKARERDDRKALFALLRANGQVPEFDTPTRTLRELARDLSPPPVTRDEVTPVTPGSVTPVTLVTEDVTAKTGTGTGTGTGIKESAPASRRARAGPLPESWRPSDVDLVYAASKGFPRDRALEIGETFRNHAHQVDRRCANWSAAWRNWVVKDALQTTSAAAAKAPRKVGVW